ncbi:MAG TPA: SIMPL domain-containing protein [Hyphomicrobiaceae bacterium]|nr:SIMPL domain-containing protein [Hyphomicrobiaceae bacterium]
MSALKPLLIAAAFAAIPLCGPRTAMAADGEKPGERFISVSATGSVDAEPDLASVSVGTIVEADTAKEALARSSTVMAKLIDGLKALGIAAKDIQTTAVDIEPRYTPPKDGRPAALAGYRLVNRVHLTVREVKRLGEILDGAIGLGANQVNGIGFDVSNAETLMDDARRLAIANARRRAELYAAAAGVQLGSVLTISETTNASPRALPMARAAAGGPMPLEAGTRTLTVAVEVTYAVR